jgi:hypothetical protein
MAAPTQQTKDCLARSLARHAHSHWPQLADLNIRHRGTFVYVAGELTDGDTLPLMRLRYLGSDTTWGFALYLASSDSYQDSILHTGTFAGSPEEALDCACELYLTTTDF